MKDFDKSEDGKLDKGELAELLTVWRQNMHLLQPARIRIEARPRETKSRQNVLHSLHLYWVSYLKMSTP
jgi:hypothetical protein